MQPTRGKITKMSGIARRLMMSSRRPAFIGATVAVSTTLTLPAHQAGDLLVMHAIGTTTNITMPSGWEMILQFTGSGPRHTWAYRVATATGTTSGTWSGATSLVCAGWRNCHPTTPVGAAGIRRGNSGAVNGNFIDFHAVTAANAGSWIAAEGAANQASFFPSGNNSIPPGLTTRDFSNRRYRVWDSDGPLASFPDTRLSGGLSSADWGSIVLELRV